MVLNLTEAIRLINHEKGINEELIVSTIESALTNAYKKYFGTTENLSITINDDFIFTVNSIQEIVEEVEDDLWEVSLSDALKIHPAAKIGDKVEIPCNPEEFGRIAIHSAKQIILQKLKEIEKNTQYSDYKSKEGEIIIGMVQRIKDDVIYVDMGNFEGILPKTNQSPQEQYTQGERIKVMISDVKNNKKGGISVYLTRRNAEFVKKLLEVEIPEIYDGTVKIMGIAREAGYRSKIAVHTDKDEIDPVGACVGMKGARIQNIIKELEGEKIDVIRWSADIKIYIKNALTPAQVNSVVLVDEVNHKAVAVMEENQLSFAIGSRGANINLAKSITGWNIEVITPAQAIDAGIVEDHIQRANDLFNENTAKQFQIEALDVSHEIIRALIDNNIFTFDQLIEIENISMLNNFTTEMVNELASYIEKYIEVVDDNDDKNAEIEEYECPECGAMIPEDADHCPSCGIEISFEEDDEEIEE